jgi:hypothetical protein
MEKYECATCKRSILIENNEQTPQCCGKKMKKMSRNICLQPAHAEHARPMEHEEPCDDFRAE